MRELESSNIWRPELECSKMCLWLSAASAQLGPPSNSRSITRSHTAPAIITDVLSVAVNSDAAEPPPNPITPADSQVTPPTKISTSDHFKMRPGLKPTATAKAIAENTVANVGIITDALRVIEIRVEGVALDVANLVNLNRCDRLRSPALAIQVHHRILDRSL